MNVWLTYDLGIKGDYPGLYKWLDTFKAKECGNNLAFLKFEYKTDIVKEILEQMTKNVNLKNGDRIYIITNFDNNATSKVLGRFIYGNRKANPWEGYAQTEDTAIDG